MPEFKLGETIETEEPQVQVEINQENPLPPGRYTFQLVVVDDSGNESLPDSVAVIIRDTLRPTAVIEAPGSVTFGESFLLDGRRSSDIGGQIVTYRWTLVEG
jgi:hypothetical protein